MQHQAKKRFGQNFLIDQNIIHKIIDAINPQLGDTIIEIGPGLGALTKPLLQRLDHLDVIELDRDVIPKLLGNCNHDDKLSVHEIDVLKFDFTQLIDTDSKLRIVGNLPYNISTPVLFHLLSYHSHIRDMYFMLQKEVVDRIAASPGDKNYGRLSVMMQSWLHVEPLFDVSAHCFSPAPKVESAIIQLIPTDIYTSRIGDATSYERLVKQAFSQRRKTLRNTLKPICDTGAIEDAGIAPSARAETLGIEQFIHLHEVLSGT